MRILSIETSCDETAISLVEASGDLQSPSFSVLGNALLSQIDVHKEYGGVYPMMAKREHAKNLTPLLQKVLIDANLFIEEKTNYSEDTWKEIEKILEREEGLYKNFRKILENIKKPDVDVMSVTSGPGLAPALWVGISFAKALEVLWGISVIGINHMEGHLASVLIESNDKNQVEFPAIALLISGGHTELVKIKRWGEYEVIGETVDDAVGEAFDKVARMLDLPYPGGPEISRLAEDARRLSLPHKARFPRPMIGSNDLKFSFSGLKTAVLYYIRDNGPVNEGDKMDIAREFEDAVVEVLINKTEKAINSDNFKTLIIAGGVVANKKICEAFSELVSKYNNLVLKIPTKNLSTDNALMITSATYINILINPELKIRTGDIIAIGNMRLGKTVHTTELK